MGHLGLFESIQQRIIIFCPENSENGIGSDVKSAHLSVTVRKYENCLINFLFKILNDIEFSVLGL